MGARKLSYFEEKDPHKMDFFSKGRYKDIENSTQKSALDYFPYGMQMPGRNGTVSGGEYRYAFNGMETDKEVSGGGNSYTTQFRQYDPRLGRWKSLDPLAGKYASMSPFVGMGNNPNFFTDPLGLEPQGGPGKESNGSGDDKVTKNEDGSTTVTWETGSYTVTTGEPGKTGTDSDGRTFVYLNFNDTDMDNAWSLANQWDQRPEGFTLEKLYEYNPGVEKNKNNLVNGQKIYTSAPVKNDNITTQNPPITTTAQTTNSVDDNYYDNPDASFWADFFREGDGPFVALSRYFTGSAKPIHDYENSLDGEDGFYGAGGKLALNTVFALVTLGQGSAFFASGKTILSFEGAWLTFDVAQSVDGFVDYSSYFPKTLKTAWDIAGLLSAKGGVLQTANMIKKGEKLLFLDAAGGVIATYEVINGVYTLVTE